jgi:hypothetical protein
LSLAGRWRGSAACGAAKLIQPLADHAIQRFEPYFLGIDSVALSLQFRRSQPGNILRGRIGEATAGDSLQQIAEPYIGEIAGCRIGKPTAISPDQVEYPDIKEVLGWRIGEPSGIPPYDIFQSCPDCVRHCRIDYGAGSAGKQLKAGANPVRNRRIHDGARPPGKHFEGSPDRVGHRRINDRPRPPGEEFECGSNPVGDCRINNGTWSAGERLESSRPNYIQGRRVARLMARPSQKRFNGIGAPSLEFLESAYPRIQGNQSV